MKFHVVPSSGSRVVLWGWTDGQTDTTKLKVAFRNSGIAPKMTSTSPCCSSCNAEPLNCIQNLPLSLCQLLAVRHDTIFLKIGVLKMFKFLSCVINITLKPKV